MPLTRSMVAAVAVATLLTGGACSRNRTPPPAPATSESPADAPATKRVVGPLSEADAAALATMNGRLKDYVDLHDRIERALPKLPDDATPQQIDKNQRLFEERIRVERGSARQGDLFTPEARPVILRLLASVFGGPDGKQLKESIMDENPVGVRVTINGRYPDTVPVSTVPPQVLQTLPRLSEDMEYRFIGDSLILLDSHAHVVADFIPDALPK